MDLAPWGSPALVARLGGGHRNEVYRIAGDLVARRSRRSVQSLDWELDLLDHLSRNDFVVPTVVPAHDGRCHADGIVVQRWLDGREPAGDDWALVAAELRRLHALLADWPRRPDLPAIRDLLTADRGGDVDLTAMPAAAVAACRAAWRAVWRAGPGPLTVIHGDPGAANLRMAGGRVGFLDWDESRVDHWWLDLADLPTPVLSPADQALAKAAVDAWEAANAWGLEPDYARRRLAHLPVDNFVDNPPDCG
ncbi:MAG: phosphotransferase [Pseudonocardiaceae bacterium]|nr:phosphotransferase [Pseudonocardiaceae bacterium]